MYLISLYHSTGCKGTKYFEAYGDEYNRIVQLLNEIEDKYSITEELKSKTYSSKELNKIIVSKSTFLNYYLNAPLSFMEQDINRIKETFEIFNPFILKETGLITQDFIDFFILVTNIEIKNYNNYFNRPYTREHNLLIKKASRKSSKLTDAEAEKLISLANENINNLKIPISELNEKMSKEKIESLLIAFTLVGEESEDYLYYTDDCKYLKKPILFIDGKHIVFIYSKQLINAIYEFLFELCSANKNERKVFEKRENLLEDKALEICKNFFGNDAKIFTNYYVNGNEKDLIVISEKHVFIIECKANKYRIPFRDPVKAYPKIKDDFNKSIGKGYNQAKEVEEVFYENEPFALRDKKGKVIEIINPEGFDEVFTIIVTQERFGQIQCDLSYLLQIDEDANFPWAVAIDDFETFLITLKRKQNYINEFVSFLLAREKLQGRVICYDELELCAYFLFDKNAFIKNCSKDEVFFSSPDMNEFFDLLYKVGFGFEDEINLHEKLNRYSFEAHSVIKKHKLRKADRVIDFINRK